VLTPFGICDGTSFPIHLHVRLAEDTPVSAQLTFKIIDSVAHTVYREYAYSATVCFTVLTFCLGTRKQHANASRCCYVRPLALEHVMCSDSRLALTYSLSDSITNGNNLRATNQQLT
jgi:hypothetical protein